MAPVEVWRNLKTETMLKTFTHPLARKATVARVHQRDGAAQDALIVVTTLELDPTAKHYKKPQVERLHEAARAYLAETPELASYAVLARPKDWDA
jgi:hypothetical protein